MEDKWLLKDPHNSTYTIKSTYAILTKSHTDSSSVMFRDLWDLLVPRLNDFLGGHCKTG